MLLLPHASRREACKSLSDSSATTLLGTFTQDSGHARHTKKRPTASKKHNRALVHSTNERSSNSFGLNLFDETEVDELSAARLSAVDSDDVRARLQRRFQRFRIEVGEVVDLMTLEFADFDAVDIDFGVFVVIDIREHIFRVRNIVFSQFDSAAQPDIVRVPNGAHDRFRSPFRAESAFAFFPGGVVEVGTCPVLSGLVESILPDLRVFARAADNDFRFDRRAAQRGVRLVHLVDRELDDFAVVRHEAVDLDFNVGRLRVDRRGEPLGDERTQRAVQRVVTLEERFLAFEGDVAPVAVFFPRVSFDRQPQSAVFAQDRGAIFLRREHIRAGVAVHIADVAALGPIRPTGGAGDNARRIELAAKIDDAVRVKLAPTFVEGDPHDDAREHIERIEHLTQFNFVVGNGFRSAFGVGSVRRNVLGGVAARHILPDEQAEPVARIVVPRGLDLDMLTQHIEPEIFQDLEIVDHAFFGRGRVQAVRPPALIQRTMLEDKFVVQQETRNSVFALADRGLAVRIVRFDLVDRFAVFDERDGQVVEYRGIGGPELLALDGELDGRAAGNDFRFLIADDDEIAFSVRDVDEARNRHVVNVGDRANFCDVRLVDRLHPDRLPNAGNRRVPNPVRIVQLLADRLDAVVRRVPNFDDERLLAFGVERAGQVDREGAVAALVRADFDVVKEDVAAPIDRAEVQHDRLASPVFGDLERRLVPEIVVFANRSADAGKRRFRAERNKNLTVGFFECFVDRKDRIVPQTVQVDPVGADHLRTRIFRKRLLGVDVLREFRQKDTVNRFPIGGKAGQNGAHGDAEERSNAQKERFSHRLPFNRG